MNTFIIILTLTVVSLAQYDKWTIVSPFFIQKDMQKVHKHIVQLCITSSWWSGLANRSIQIKVIKSLSLYLANL